jgi:hypothetical protein
MFFVSSFCRVIEETLQRLEGKRKEKERLQHKIKENPDPNALSKAIKKHNDSRNGWFMRRAMCMDAVDLMADGMGKKNKQMMVSFKEFLFFTSLFSFLHLIIV